MRTRNICAEQWKAFCSDFTQLHRGKRVHVETIEDGVWGVKSHLCGKELIGVVNMPIRHGERESSESIEVIVREEGDKTASHTIGQPDRVSVAEENGNTIALQIDSSNGTVTMIRFEHSNQNMPEGFLVA